MLESIVILGLATGTISTTVAQGKLFRPVRSWVSEKNEWLGNLLGCPFCLGHWVGLASMLCWEMGGLEVQVWWWVAMWAAIVGVGAIVNGVITKLVG